MEWLAFALTWGLPFVLYVSLQATAAWKLEGGWRTAALLPILPMLGVVVLTIRAYQAESNLWPLLLILGSPAAAAYLALILAVRPRQAAAEGQRVTNG